LADLDAQFYGSDTYVGLLTALDQLTAEDGYVTVSLNEIDAKYWYKNIQNKTTEALSDILKDNNFSSWNKWNTTTDKNGNEVEDKTTANIYSIAQAFFDKLIAKVKNYDIEGAKLTSTTPYSDACDYFGKLQSTALDELKALEQYYDTEHTVFGDDATAAEDLPVPADYVSYATTKLNALDLAMLDMRLAYSPKDSNTVGADHAIVDPRYGYDLGDWLADFDADYQEIVANISVGLTDPDKIESYIDALAEIDARCGATERVLQKDIYEMKTAERLLTLLKN
jgi:hypothetical protein